MLGRAGIQSATSPGADRSYQQYRRRYPPPSIGQKQDHPPLTRNKTQRKDGQEEQELREKPTYREPKVQEQIGDTINTAEGIHHPLLARNKTRGRERRKGRGSQHSRKSRTSMESRKRRKSRRTRKRRGRRKKTELV